MKHYSKVIDSPLVTEKGTLVNELGNQVLFRVRSDANKVEIAEAVEMSRPTVERVRQACVENQPDTEVLASWWRPKVWEAVS